jgi:hypothetical protein
MKQRLRTLWLCFSLLALLVLAFGYTTRFGPKLIRQTSAGAPVQVTELCLDRGWVRLLVASLTPLSIATASPTEFAWDGPSWQGPPHIRRSIWEFDAHRIPDPSASIFILAFPIWCLALPFVIAPALWLHRRHRARSTPKGFDLSPVASAVELPAVSAVAPPSPAPSH